MRNLNYWIRSRQGMTTIVGVFIFRGIITNVPTQDRFQSPIGLVLLHTSKTCMKANVEGLICDTTAPFDWAYY